MTSEKDIWKGCVLELVNWPITRIREIKCPYDANNRRYTNKTNLDSGGDGEITESRGNTWMK